MNIIVGNLSVLEKFYRYLTLPWQPSLKAAFRNFEALALISDSFD